MRQVTLLTSYLCWKYAVNSLMKLYLLLLYPVEMFEAQLYLFIGLNSFNYA